MTTEPTNAGIAVRALLASYRAVIESGAFDAMTQDQRRAWALRMVDHMFLLTEGVAELQATVGRMLAADRALSASAAAAGMKVGLVPIDDIGDTEGSA